MRHEFECSSCGGKIITGCFDSSPGRAVFVYDPPLPKKVPEGQTMIQVFASRKTTIFCVPCFEKIPVRTGTVSGNSDPVVPT